MDHETLSCIVGRANFREVSEDTLDRFNIRIFHVDVEQVPLYSCRYAVANSLAHDHGTEPFAESVFHGVAYAARKGHAGANQGIYISSP